MQLSSGFIYALHLCHQNLSCFTEDVHTRGEKKLKQAQVKTSTGTCVKSLHLIAFKISQRVIIQWKQ